jgi:hypothetical protein
MSNSNRKPIDVSAFASAAMAQPDPVATVVAASAVPAAEPAVEPPTAVRERPKAKVMALKPAGRAGKVGLQMWVEPEKRKKLKRYAVDAGRTVDALLAEALDDLLRKLKVH